MIFTNQSIETTIGTYSSLCKVYGKILRFGTFWNFNGAYRTWWERRNIRNSYWLVSQLFYTIWILYYFSTFKEPYIVIDGKSRAKFFLVTCVKMNLKQKNIWLAPIFLAALKWGNNLVTPFQKWVENNNSSRNIKLSFRNIFLTLIFVADFDRDGLEDVAVSAPTWSDLTKPETANYGRVYIFKQKKTSNGSSFETEKILQERF